MTTRATKFKNWRRRCGHHCSQPPKKWPISRPLLTRRGMCHSCDFMCKAFRRAGKQFVKRTKFYSLLHKGHKARITTPFLSPHEGACETDAPPFHAERIDGPQYKRATQGRAAQTCRWLCLHPGCVHSPRCWQDFGSELLSRYP